MWGVSVSKKKLNWTVQWSSSEHCITADIQIVSRPLIIKDVWGRFPVLGFGMVWIAFKFVDITIYPYKCSRHTCFKTILFICE